MGRTAPGRRIDLNGSYAGRPCVEQSEQDRVEAIGGIPASGQRDPNQDVLYPSDATPPSKDDPDRPAARPTKGGRRLEKGSKAAKEHMARLREMRGRKKTETTDKPQDEETEDAE